tara:strand:+ start:277 stop:837 length:561 start_codon:yes stop_codon:yes gene_type:complete
MMFRSFSGPFQAIPLAFALLAFTVTAPAAAQKESPQPDSRVGPANPSGFPIPRWVSVGAREANLRTGPGARYPIDWVLQRRNLPAEVISEFENWRQIKVQDGTVGWVHKSMLSGRRMATVAGNRVRMRENPAADAPVAAFVEAGVVVTLRGCEATWCQVTIASHGVEGWIPRDTLWGIYDGEVVSR